MAVTRSISCFCFCTILPFPHTNFSSCPAFSVSLLPASPPPLCPLVLVFLLSCPACFFLLPLLLPLSTIHFVSLPHLSSHPGLICLSVVCLSLCLMPLSFHLCSLHSSTSSFLLGHFVSPLLPASLSLCSFVFSSFLYLTLVPSRHPLPCHLCLSLPLPSAACQSLLIPGKSASRFGRRGSAIGIGTVEEVVALGATSSGGCLHALFSARSQDRGHIGDVAPFPWNGAPGMQGGVWAALMVLSPCLRAWHLGWSEGPSPGVSSPRPSSAQAHVPQYRRFCMECLVPLPSQYPLTPELA